MSKRAMDSSVVVAPGSAAAGGRQDPRGEGEHGDRRDGAEDETAHDD